MGTHLTITAVDGDRVAVDGEWVETRQKGGTMDTHLDWIVGGADTVVAG